MLKNQIDNNPFNEKFFHTLHFVEESHISHILNTDWIKTSPAAAPAGPEKSNVCVNLFPVNGVDR